MDLGEVFDGVAGLQEREEVLLESSEACWNG